MSYYIVFSILERYFIYNEEVTIESHPNTQHTVEKPSPAAKNRTAPKMKQSIG